jgi:hypothetical protein
MGTGFALRVVVDLSGLPDTVKGPIQTAYATLRAGLPADAKALLPASFPFKIDQRFIETLAEMGAAEKAQAILARGLVNLPGTAEATKPGESNKVNTAAKSIPSADLPIVNVSIGELLASVAAGPKVDGDGVLSKVSATLADLVDLGILPTELTDALTGLTGTINTAVADANTQLDGVLDEVATNLQDVVASDPTGVVSGTLGGLGLLDEAEAADPTALISQLTTLVNLDNITSLLQGNIAAIYDLNNHALSQKTSSAAVSEATSKIASVNVLGLVNVGVIDLMSRSTAGGTPGSAKNASHCSIANVKLGGSNGVSLDGKSIYVNGKALPVPVADIGAIKGVVDDLLAVAGLKVGLCDVAQSSADADGTSAAQRVSAFRVEFAPNLPALGQVLKVIVDPTVETAVAARVAPAAQTQPNLPRTGAPMAATALTGLGLAGSALILRRRFS